MNRTRWGIALEALREKRGLSRKDLLSLSGMDSSQYYKILYRQRNGPTLEVLNRLLLAMECSWQDWNSAIQQTTGKSESQSKRELILDPAAGSGGILLSAMSITTMIRSLKKQLAGVKQDLAELQSKVARQENVARRIGSQVRRKGEAASRLAQGIRDSSLRPVSSMESSQSSLYENIQQPLVLEMRPSKMIYSKKEPIILDLRLLNRGSHRVTLHFRSGQRYDVVLRNLRGRQLWRWSTGQVFPQVMGDEILPAQGELPYQVRVKEQFPVGRYKFVGTILAEGSSINSESLVVSVTSLGASFAPVVP